MNHRPRHFVRPGRSTLPAAALALAAAAGAVGALTACSSNKPRPQAQTVRPERIREMPDILRRTIGAETTLRGNEPMLVSGYGIVVGLAGTGSPDSHPAVRTMLEREMARRGVGRESTGMGWTTPGRMIEDPNTAVVLVQAVIPPGAVAGTRVDVLVSAIPGSSTTSLEGGRLWTTDLRPGLILPGGPDVQAVGEASGDLFINPFADPAAEGEDAINRRTGRILSGGVVKATRELLLVLDNPSHARARSMVAAINARFPMNGAKDRVQTAWGLSEESIQITVPAAYSQDTEEFVELLMASRVELGYPEEWARRYTQALKAQPELAMELSWRIQALGKAAIPFVRDMYDYSEAMPRMAALRAGARLGDALATPHLSELALSGPPTLRTRAIELLGDMGPDPKVNTALRTLVDAPEIDVRLAAYEALATRRDPSIVRYVMGGKFAVDTIPSSDPMIYVSQQGEPRIVIFGPDLALRRPTLVTGWGDRLMLAADSPGEDIRVYYRDYRTGRSARDAVDALLTKFIQFLAHKQTPEQPSPGLALTYSQVVGALHEIWTGHGIDAKFVAEQDKLAAAFLRSLDPVELQERPEFSDEDPGAEALAGSAPAEAAPKLGERAEEEAPTRKRGNFVVPVPTPPSPK